MNWQDKIYENLTEAGTQGSGTKPKKKPTRPMDYGDLHAARWAAQRGSRPPTRHGEDKPFKRNLDRRTFR